MAVLCQDTSSIQRWLQELKGNIRVFCRVRPLVGGGPSLHILLPPDDHKALVLARSEEVSQPTHPIMPLAEGRTMGIDEISAGGPFFFFFLQNRELKHTLTYLDCYTPNVYCIKSEPNPLIYFLSMNPEYLL